ncbi:hypothetical protein FVR03_23020 [Pontibacter qinzhouensis]|uniref:Transcriptional regulator n=1 Tax=Pontibacter qinzhouensis TaxID=2603253 RepID=A0A5C8IMT7_9BACT|nr:hypothetical protein [Pontibacter qinzhouensis]TXK22431.1 hypothetical protein FVR03_23020 [Pontibacter qinzhouensis]
MEVKPIRTEAGYQAALQRIEKLWEAVPGSPEAGELEVLVLLVSRFEQEHYPIEEPEPGEYARIRREELDVGREHSLGRKSREP